jgi:hypothetical protein
LFFVFRQINYPKEYPTNKAITTKEPTTPFFAYGGKDISVCCSVQIPFGLRSFKKAFTKPPSDPMAISDWFVLCIPFKSTVLPNKY